MKSTGFRPPDLSHLFKAPAGAFFYVFLFAWQSRELSINKDIAMNFKEKKQAFNELLGVEQLERDIVILTALNVNSPALQVSGNRDKQEKEVLWELLDILSPAEIRERRKGIVPTAPLAAIAGKAVLPVKKKVSTRKLNIPVLTGKTLTMKMCRKPLSSIMTGLTVLRKSGNWMWNWTINRLLRKSGR